MTASGPYKQILFAVGNVSIIGVTGLAVYAALVGAALTCFISCADPIAAAADGRRWQLAALLLGLSGTGGTAALVAFRRRVLNSAWLPVMLVPIGLFPLLFMVGLVLLGPFGVSLWGRHFSAGIIVSAWGCLVGVAGAVAVVAATASGRRAA